MMDFLKTYPFFFLIAKTPFFWRDFGGRLVRLTSHERTGAWTAVQVLLGTWHRKSHNPRGKLTWLAGKWTMNEDVGFLFENGDISLPAMLVY